VSSGTHPKCVVVHLTYLGSSGTRPECVVVHLTY